MWMSIIASSLIVLLLAVALPAEAESGRQVNVNMNYEHENFMWTITKDSFYGGLFGTLVAFAGLLLSEFEMDPAIIGYCAGGGILLGAGVGVWEVSTRRNVLDPQASAEPPMQMERAHVVRVLSVEF
ncbi:MAG: hypothetical protein CO108_04880 [Deltaproteobacteria bacterium CG_4_9_14_3_um_filter_63_12]|nr:MAG: hypothetical protein CO108_04880 [Deltaproteobacteria bacterium CG_4_9_14_3_um_filter_63_12]